MIVVWGCNPIASNSDNFYGGWVVDCMQRGSRLITVDPSLTWLAARSDYWLRLRPGTDGALALAMLNVIISEDLYDREFVEKWCYGFDELCRARQGMDAGAGGGGVLGSEGHHNRGGARLREGQARHHPLGPAH